MKLKPGNYAVIFTSMRAEVDEEYYQTFEELMQLAKQVPGFIGIESARDGLGITVSYWESMDAINTWRTNSAHVMAKNKGRSEWYKSFTSTITRIESSHSFEA